MFRISDCHHNYISHTGKVFTALSLLLLTPLCLTGCSLGKPEAETEILQEEKPIQIGMSFDTFVLERWLRDRDVFISSATELGAEVNVQNANSDADEQISQINYLINKDVDVLVVIAIDGTSDELKASLAKAKNKGIKIIAYDRIIQDADVDLYISFDNEKVGTLMAEAVLSKIPEDGKIAALLGSPSDYNVTMVETGIQNVLKEHDAELVYKNYSDNWKAEYAYEQMNECLDQEGPVDGVICGNDGLAAAAFKSLSEHRLLDNVVLVGQDADIDACQRIVEGTQYMTVYKSIDQLARCAAECAVKIAKEEDLNLTETFDDGSHQVPYLKLTPIAVTAENMDEEIISSRFHLANEVYLNVE